MTIGTKMNIVKGVLVLLIVLSTFQLQAQTTQQYTLLQILPVVTFVISIAVALYQLSIGNKIYKTKEEILGIIRTEFNREIENIDQKAATRDQVEWLRTEMKLMMSNLELKINQMSNLEVKINQIQNQISDMDRKRPNNTHQK